MASPNTSKVRWPPLVCRPLPLSLPRGLPKGCVGDGNHHCDMSSCCGVYGSLFQSLYFRISVGNGFRESSWSAYSYAEVPLVRCWSCCAKFFRTLRSATMSSIATLVRERNPRFLVFEGTCPKLLYRYNITNR
jgi:hypothetical protein